MTYIVTKTKKRRPTKERRAKGYTNSPAKALRQYTTIRLVKGKCRSCKSMAAFAGAEYCTKHGKLYTEKLLKGK